MKQTRTHQFRSTHKVLLFLLATFIWYSLVTCHNASWFNSSFVRCWPQTTKERIIKFSASNLIAKTSYRDESRILYIWSDRQDGQVKKLQGQWLISEIVGWLA